MTDIAKVKLEMAVSDIMLGLLDEQQAGQFDDVPRGDLQGIVEAKAMHIIKLVKEAK